MLSYQTVCTEIIYFTAVNVYGIPCIFGRPVNSGGLLYYAVCVWSSHSLPVGEEVPVGGRGLTFSCLCWDLVRHSLLVLHHSVCGCVDQLQLSFIHKNIWTNIPHIRR